MHQPLVPSSLPAWPCHCLCVSRADCCSLCIVPGKRKPLWLVLQRTASMNLPTHSHHLCCFFNCIGLVSGTRTPNLNPVQLKGAYTGSQNTRRGCGVNSGKGSNATKLKKSWSQASNTSKTPSPFLVLLHPLSAQTCVRKHGCLWPLNFVALYFLLLKPKRILTHLGSGVHSQTNQHGQEQDLFKYLAAPEVALGIYWRAIPRRWVEPSRNPETSSC